MEYNAAEEKKKEKRKVWEISRCDQEGWKGKGGGF